MNNAADISVHYGFHTNTFAITTEKFTSREAAWKRVQELMALRSDHHQHTGTNGFLAVLDVTQPREGGKGSKISQFRRYIEGSSQCKWGQWGVSTFETTGETFG